MADFSLYMVGKLTECLLKPLRNEDRIITKAVQTTRSPANTAFAEPFGRVQDCPVRG